ncbi:MAG: GNAT family N-acetyltransferase [Alphaproteobacteria bacterium]|nr:GNAT family N-acetyltransferase [Alphaproteobacteria bacterium]
MIVIGPFQRSERAAWEKLARGYNDFYETELPDSDYDRAWDRLLQDREIHGLGARLDDQLIGIAHYLFHASIWRDHSCYLQDLFVDETVRGQGAARRLIDAVADAARQRGAVRYYWQTKQDNARARALYDKVARFRGFIRYDYALGQD